jgi:hypothetical protein
VPVSCCSWPIRMAQNGTDGGNGKIMEDPNLVVQNLPQSFEGWMAHTCTHCMSMNRLDQLSFLGSFLIQIHSSHECSVQSSVATTLCTRICNTTPIHSFHCIISVWYCQNWPLGKSHRSPLSTCHKDVSSTCIGHVSVVVRIPWSLANILQTYQKWWKTKK